MTAIRRLALSLWLVCGSWAPALAQTAPPPEDAAPATVFPHNDDSWLSVSGQVNVIAQSYRAFRAAYSGDNSFPAGGDRATSGLFTLSTRIRPVANTSLSIDVESAAGGGVGEALGIAGFTNLDVVRNPTLGSKPYLARLVLHQSIPLGDSVSTTADAESDSDAEGRSLEFSAGKLSTADYFDRNSIGSDSHLQFMNWAVDNNGAYDYAADTRGYTWGVVAEYRSQAWSLMFGEMLMPAVANGLSLDRDLRHARAENLELTLHPQIAGSRAATIRLLTYANHANMGDYREAVQRFESGIGLRPVIEDTRKAGRVKYGVGVGVEQPLSDTARAFGRWGWNEAHYESFAYTEVNNSLTVGGDVVGASWHRSSDRLGAAFVSNGLSAEHQQYLALGGIGFLLGDGALTYGRESIVEAYYTAHVWRGVSVAGDVQRIANPGYNRDRGPVTVVGFRLHLDL